MDPVLLASGAWSFNLWTTREVPTFLLCFFKKKKVLCIYFWPCWVFHAVSVFSLMEASRGCSLVAVCGLLTAVASLVWGAQIRDQGLNLCSPGAQLVKNPPAMRETWVRPLGWEDPLEKGKATTPVFWPGEFYGPCSPWGGKEPDMIERHSLHFPALQANSLPLSH